jgi:hypothetical protein
MAKYYFAAANTGAGFCGRFEGINPRGKFLHILKGGPGTGKSTLIKKVGKFFESAGEEAEYFYCSSDPSSLDGVRIPRLGVAVIDGTPPHAVEPLMPNVMDAIVNLGDFIGGGVREHKIEISKLAGYKKECFDTAYGYIRAAAAISAANMRVLARFTGTAAAQYTMNIQCTNEIERKLFISAVAGDGKVNLAGKNRYEKVVSLSGNDFAAKEILKEVRGGILFGDLLSPDEPEAVEIGDTLIMINAPEPTEVVDLSKTLAGGFEAHRSTVEYGNKQINKFLGFAAIALADAKAAHAEIEAFYYKYMDFAALDRVAERLIREIVDKN